MNTQGWEIFKEDFVFEDRAELAKRPLWPDAAATMNIDVVVNKDSSIWVFHDQHFPEYLEWVEFDEERREMTFVTAKGKIQNLGLTLHPPMDRYVAQAKQVCVVLVKDNEFRDVGMLPLAVRKPI